MIDTLMIKGDQSPLKKVNDTNNLGNHDQWNYLRSENSIVFDIIKEKAKLSIAILVHNSRK